MLPDHTVTVPLCCMSLSAVHAAHTAYAAYTAAQAVFFYVVQSCDSDIESVRQSDGIYN